MEKDIKQQNCLNAESQIDEIDFERGVFFDMIALLKHSRIVGMMMKALPATFWYFFDAKVGRQNKSSISLSRKWRDFAKKIKFWKLV